jgi:hypothetical protein
MEVAGKTRTMSRGRLISISVIAAAVALALYAFHESNTHPTSSDSSIDADVVHVAAAVGGRIIQLPVVENMRVSEGNLLFQIDPPTYRLAVEQSTAELGIAKSLITHGWLAKRFRIYGWRLTRIFAIIRVWTSIRAKPGSCSRVTRQISWSCSLLSLSWSEDSSGGCVAT